MEKSFFSRWAERMLKDKWKTMKKKMLVKIISEVPAMRKYDGQNGAAALDRMSQVLFFQLLDCLWHCTFWFPGCLSTVVHPRLTYSSHFSPFLQMIWHRANLERYSLRKRWLLYSNPWTLSHEPMVLTKPYWLWHYLSWVFAFQGKKNVLPRSQGLR